ncbi:MAG: hypothetical protein IIB45_07975 [Candidatus Marinimicrobia bacterium]|nr:hypothetical protein [Candidatus Neomarinimicrobiota bacterium]
MKVKIATIIFISSFIAGQGSTTAAFGTVTIDGKVWNQVSIRPVTPFWKFNIAWDLAFYFDHNGNVYGEHWDFSSLKKAKNTVIDKIYYLSYGRMSDPLYFKIGALDRVDLGYGILVDGYSNTVQYPEVRNIGLDIRSKNKFGSVQGFVNDFKQNIGVAGARFIVPKLLPVPFALTMVVDRNQYLGLKDSDGDGIPNRIDHFPNNSHYWMDSDGDGLADNHRDEFDRDGDGLPDVYDLEVIHAFWDELGESVGQDFSNETYYDSLPDQTVDLLPEPLNVNTSPNRMGALAIDFGYPIYAQDNMAILIYAQAAKMIGSTPHPGTGKKLNLGIGIVPLGFSALFGPATFNLEYRMIPKGQFEFSYWNRTYDLERATFVTTQDNINVVTKEAKLGHYGDQKGFYARLGLRIGSFIKVESSYQNLIGRNWDVEKVDYILSENQSLMASLNLIKQIGRIINAQLFYQQRNVSNPFKFDRTESTIMGYHAGIEIGSGLMLNYTFQRSFRDLDGDGDVDSPDETINLITIETSFTL